MPIDPHTPASPRTAQRDWRIAVGGALALAVCGSLLALGYAYSKQVLATPLPADQAPVAKSATIELPAAPPLPPAAATSARTGRWCCGSHCTPETQMFGCAADGLSRPDSPRRYPIVAQIRQGITRVHGPLPPEVVNRITRQNFGRFRLCYEQGRSRQADLNGDIIIGFAIDSQGAVTRSRVEGSTLADTETISCILHGFDNLSFPQPDHGLVQVRYSLEFSMPGPN